MCSVKHLIRPLVMMMLLSCHFSAFANSFKRYDQDDAVECRDRPISIRQNLIGNVVDELNQSQSARSFARKMSALENRYESILRNIGGYISFFVSTDQNGKIYIIDGLTSQSRMPARKVTLHAPNRRPNTYIDPHHALYVHLHPGFC